MNVCKICGKEIKDKHILCKKCWEEKENIKDQRYHLKNEFYMIDQYYDFFISKELEQDVTAYNMLALAEILDEKIENSILLNNVFEDIQIINNIEKIINTLESRYTSTKDVDEEESIKNRLSLLEFEIAHNEKEIEFYDDYRQKYQKNNRCNDGHYVRSRAEQIIDNFLYKKKIFHEYEKPVYDKETKEQFSLVDFFLPYDEGIYIEVFGMNTAKYTETKEYKEKMYTKNELRLIPITQDDICHIEDKLEKELMEYINKPNKMDSSL